MTKKKEQEVEFQDVVGTPTSMLLPARNYKFKVQNQEYSIVIPRKGKYVELDSEMFSDDDGEFNVMQYSRKDKAHIVSLPDISRILFATSKYPDLKDTQAFTPIALVIKTDTVEITGNVIEMKKEN